MPKNRERTPSPYGSAHDLPSYQELDRQIQGGKLLTRFIAREQRSELLKLEEQMNRLVAVVDRFYERLGPRNWIFHELLNVSAIEAILDQTGTDEEAEQRFIDLYRDNDNLTSWIRRLSGVEGLRERAHQIERALEHYDTDQFGSTALQLIAVMDGFVNDFEPDQRRGLASRDPDTMTAWDSVVGHHLGLTNALKAFDKTIKKRVDEEVYELHRHGIVHGTVTRFDNVVVATKAWNMLFALVRLGGGDQEGPPAGRTSADAPWRRSADGHNSEDEGATGGLGTESSLGFRCWLRRPRGPRADG